MEKNLFFFAYESGHQENIGAIKKSDGRKAKRKFQDG